MKLKVFFILCVVASLSQQAEINGGKKLTDCSKCPPGWGVWKKCSRNEDTICRLCENGRTYSSVTSSVSKCRHCSRCGVGLYEAHSCISTKDTVCDECINFIGRKKFIFQPDFLKKCSYIF